MTPSKDIRVAVLLPTFNGADFVAPQIASLKDNSTQFTLHWIDDHSTDRTREKVLAAARASSIELCEWRRERRLGYPSVYFELIESVDADIYLFCDQDDIWQPGKIDAVVASLRPDIDSPVLAFSDPLVFFQDEPTTLRRLSDVLQLKLPAVMEDSRMFMCFPGIGHTMAFTRRLRDIYFGHREIARTYAYAHDWWIYFIATAAGVRRWLTHVPTTLYRQHGSNFTGFMYSRGGMSLRELLKIQQRLRPLMARQAEGFIQAAGTLPQSEKVAQLVSIARLTATLDRRQSPATLIKLARHSVFSTNRKSALCLAALCLCSNADMPRQIPRRCVAHSRIRASDQ